MEERQKRDRRDRIERDIYRDRQRQRGRQRQSQKRQERHNNVLYPRRAATPALAISYHIETAMLLRWSQPDSGRLARLSMALCYFGGVSSTVAVWLVLVWRSERSRAMRTRTRFVSISLSSIVFNRSAGSNR